MLLDFKNRGNVQLEGEKLRLSISLMNSVYFALKNLISIKKNYFGKLNEDPCQRVRSVPLVCSYDYHIEDDIEDLDFITIVDNIADKSENDWSYLPVISNMVSDYNILINLWTLRNKYLEKFSDQFDQGATYEEIMDSDKSLDYIHLIDLTEMVIRFTDSQILLLIDFLKNFPTVAEEFISLVALRQFGRVAIEGVFISENEIFEETISVNISKLRYIMKQSELELENLYH
ncbi:MAG: hypothetical protein HOH18_09530 [Kordiimonadaceae bacterium]|jgi:hypothetical protein|nr:hypothetical protein [Kordiimonadaceae bacterium]MBT6036699.1 hypothetical protein [Kordiimonadaceae bacterium]MBT7582406.1 hypothetical protein [Kordiimonadaceae bacterium]